MSFTKDQTDRLKAIHHQLMALFTYERDEDKKHSVDYWEGAGVLRPTGPANTPFTGDCEEFAMVAVQKLNSEGYQARLVVCEVETGEGHCIAEVSTPNLDASYFLDNRRRDIATKQQLARYSFYSVGPWNPQPGDKRVWHRVAE